MLTRIVNLFAARLANANVLPLDTSRYATDARKHLEALENRAKELKFTIDDFALKHLKTTIDQEEAQARATMNQVFAAVESGRFARPMYESINKAIKNSDREWLDDSGLPDRPWFRNWFAASDPDAGYASAMLPALKAAIERKDAKAAERAMIEIANMVGAPDNYFPTIQPDGTMIVPAEQLR